MGQPQNQWLPRKKMKKNHIKIGRLRCSMMENAHFVCVRSVWTNPFLVLVLGFESFCFCQRSGFFIDCGLFWLLCGQVNMLKERNKQYGAIKFVDISSNDYSPEDNQGLDYKTVCLLRNLLVLKPGTSLLPMYL